MDRLHAVECSGVYEKLLDHSKDLEKYKHEKRRNLLDIYIQSFRRRKPLKRNAVFIGRLIRAICINCVDIDNLPDVLPDDYG